MSHVLNSRNRTLIVNEIQGLNQIPKIQMSFIQIQSPDMNFLYFIQNLLSFGQSVNNQSCSKCPNLPPEFFLYFSDTSSYFPGL
jgi:hypothetical protein